MIGSSQVIPLWYLLEVDYTPPPKFFKLTSSSRIEAQLKSADDTQFTVPWYCLKAGLDEVKIALIVPTQGGLPCARPLIPWFAIWFHRAPPGPVNKPWWSLFHGWGGPDWEGQLRAPMAHNLMWVALGIQTRQVCPPTKSGQIVATFQHLRATFTNLAILAFQGHYWEVFL